MSQFRIWCRYEPGHHNQVAGRQGQWRVIRSGQIQDWPADTDGMLWLSAEHKWQALCIESTKKYPCGCIIRPHKELNRVLESRLPPRNPKLDEIGKRLGMERGRWERDGNYRARLKAQVEWLQQLNNMRKIAA